MAWYLIVENGAPVGISNDPTGESYPIDADQLYLDSYSIVDGQAVYDASYATAQEGRQRRNFLLANTDWTQARDIPDETAVKWQPYRQALRDVTDRAGFPDNITWPSEP